MTSVYFDSELGDDARRERLYRGDIFVYSPRNPALELARLARDMAEQAFDPHPPEMAQYHLPVEEYAAVLAELKPKFIHHPDAKKHIQALLEDLGCDPDQVYFDVPRLRSSTSDGYLTSGIAYAFHPHRDTWYSAPYNQINWWFPVYKVEAENGMAFHPRYFDRPVKNSSECYNYYEWNKKNRRDAARHVKKDTREQPKALEEIELQPELRVVAEVGGVMAFSGAHLHSSVENNTGRTRFSIDFRTVHAGDAAAMRGAVNVDSRCTGTTMRDYLRVSDLSHLPDEIVERYESGPIAPSEHLVYRPDASGKLG